MLLNNGGKGGGKSVFKFYQIVMAIAEYKGFHVNFEDGDGEWKEFIKFISFIKHKYDSDREMIEFTNGNTVTLVTKEK